MGISPEKKVGVLFFLGVALLAVFTIVLTDIRIFRKQYQVIVIFDNVGGLERGNKVTLGGMQVGSVRELVQRRGRIRVILGIDERVEIPRDSVFRLGDIGLLGGKRVDITWGDEASGFLADGDTVEGISAPGLSEAIAGLGEASDNLDQILLSIRETTEQISRGEGTVGRLIVEDDLYRDLRAISSRIAEGEGTIGKLVEDPGLYEDLREFFADLQLVVEENRRKVEEIVDRLRDTTPSLQETMKNLEEITAKINRGEGTIGRLITEDDLYTEARATLASVDTAGQQLTDVLSAIDRVRIYVGAEYAYNTRSERSLTKAYFELEPTPSKLYRVGVTLDAGKGTEADRTDDVDAEIEAQLGLRFFDNRLTVRGGLLEGRVGGGLDYRIWGRELVLTVEGRDVWTREKDEGIDPFLLRAYVDTNIWWGFYLRLGVDNILDEPGFYGGAGLRLRDDDIKVIFGLLSL